TCKIGTSDSARLVDKRPSVDERDSAGLSRTPSRLYNDYKHRVPDGRQESRAACSKDWKRGHFRTSYRQECGTRHSAGRDPELFRRPAATHDVSTDRVWKAHA